MVITAALLAVSLSIDALGVGIAYGLRKIKIPLAPKLMICLFSILYSGLALIVGKSLSTALPPFISKLIGVTILVIMGIGIILQSALKKENVDLHNQYDIEEKTLVKWVIKSLGITIQVVRNPLDGDIDKSGIIDIRESILLGLALSIDAIGVGIGSALAGFHSLTIPLSVGFFQLCFLYMGLYLGKKVVVASRLNKKVISFIPGILLISLAILRIC